MDIQKFSNTLIKRFNESKPVSTADYKTDSEYKTLKEAFEKYFNNEIAEKLMVEASRHENHYSVILNPDIFGYSFTRSHKMLSDVAKDFFRDTAIKINVDVVQACVFRLTLMW